MRAPEAPKARAVTRILDRSEDRSGYHATNFVGDLRDLLAAPQEVVGDEARSFLMRLKNRSLTPDENAPERVSVVMTLKNWRSFNRLRQDVLRHRDAARYRTPSLPAHRNHSDDGYPL